MHALSATSQPGRVGLHFRGSKFFLLAHPDCKDPQSARNPSAPPNSANSFCSTAARRFPYRSLSIVRHASPCRDDLRGRPHALFPVGSHCSAPSPSSISSSNAPDVFVHAPSLPGSPPDAVALPLCLVCDLASAKSCSDCEQQFCVNHIYSCADCGNQYCGACLEAHHADGHWADSDTAFELASAQAVVRASSVNRLDLPSSGFPRDSISLLLENAAGNQHRHSSSSIPATLKSLFSFLLQRLTPLTSLLGLTFHNITLQSEAGL
jgi:hypothetical protein